MGLRGVSEMVSASLLALIVLVVGGVVVASILGRLEAERQRAVETVVEKLEETRQALAPVMAYQSGGTVYVVVASGDYPVRILSVYVDNQPGSCRLVYSNGTSVAVEGALVPPYASATLECSVATTGAHLVKIVYEGGSVAVLAE